MSRHRLPSGHLCCDPTRATTPLGAGAAAVYERFVDSEDGSVDFSGIIRYLRGP